MTRKFAIPLYLIISAILIFVDRLTKLWAANNLISAQSDDLLTGFLSLTLVQNKGAAFGIGSGQQNILIAIAVVVLIVLLLYLALKRKHSVLQLISLALISAGAIGNVIDRIQFGYVIDFLQFEFIDFPVFNVADICVCAGVALFFITAIVDIIKEQSDKNN